jgi:tRNA threonylcarbamoyladenosine biosynthesis protein TsaB
LIVLGIDTCLPACSVAVVDGDGVLAAASEPMDRGHQERLAPLVEATLRASGAAFADIERIGVTVGPGSFTGLRVGLAFAKGLGLALGRPVAAVGALPALAASAARSGFVAAAIDARRGQLYLQAFQDGRAVIAADALTVADAAALLIELHRGGPATLVGSGAALLADVLPQAVVSGRVAPDPVVVARLAAAAEAPLPPPRPLYLRAPDAKLPASALA